MSKADGIEQRGSGTWRIIVATGRDPVTGRYGRIRETVHGTKTDARKRRNDLLVQVARGTAVQADRETAAVFLERWIAHRESIGKVRPKVAHTCRGYVRREVSPRIGSMQLAAVRPVHVQRALDEALGSGLSARSVVQVHRIMHAAFRQAVRWQILSVNPSDGATPPKIEQARLTVPAPSDIARLLTAVDADYRTPLALAAGTGLRRGELLALTWPAVDSRIVHGSALPGRSNDPRELSLCFRQRQSVRVASCRCLQPSPRPCGVIEPNRTSDGCSQVPRGTPESSYSIGVMDVRLTLMRSGERSAPLGTP